SSRASTCSRAAAPPSSAAAMPERAVSASSALMLALPRRSSSPAAEAAPRRASLAAPAAVFRWALASLRLPLMFSLELALICVLLFGGCRDGRTWASDHAAGVGAVTDARPIAGPAAPARYRA